MTVHPHNTIAIRRALAADAPRVAEIAERTFRDTFAGDNSEQDMQAHCARAYSPEIQAEEIADPSIDTLVCVDADGQFVGYAQIRPGAPKGVDVARPLELWRFYIDRAHHGRGLAHALMTSVIDAARARGAGTLWLGVWERNPRARAFYRKHGFVDIGAHKFVVGTDVQTDVLMARSLTPR